MERVQSKKEGREDRVKEGEKGREQQLGLEMEEAEDCRRE